MSDNEAERAQGGAYPSDYENQRAPAKPGEPPRPATEPKGAKGSSDTTKTLTDPATGAPHEEAKKDPAAPS